jgi:beta-glucosidase
MNGGWTITWQGNEESLYPAEKNTVLEAIQNKIGTSNVKYVEGTGFDKDINTNLAVLEANNSDVVIICLGEPAYCESPGNIFDLKLNEVQLNLVEEISKTGKPIILVLLEGRPRIVTEIVDLSSAIVVGFLPGMEGGNAIADVLFGDANPSGKLPITYPKYANGFTTYDYKPIENYDGNKYDPLWSFGCGLSYTNFDYSNLRLSKSEITENDVIEVSIDVKNTGNLVGKEVVQLYLTDLFGTVSRPNKQLKGFEKIELKPGETKTVKFSLTKEHLSFIGLENKRIVEPGDFQVTINKSSAKFTLK